MKYHCNCWLCTKAKTKKAIAREKEKRYFRCRSRMVDSLEDKSELQRIQANRHGV